MSTGSLIALTGGTGFVGSHVAEALLEAGCRVRALVRRPESPGWLKGLPVDVVKGDVRDAGPLGALVTGCDAVVHAAGKTSARSEADYMAANAAGTANLVAATLREAPGAHFLLVSSQAAAGPSRDGAPVRVSDAAHPVSTYGRSKLEGENELRRATRLGWTILRPCAVYGPRETAIRTLFVAASRGVVPLLAGGFPKLQLVYVADLAAALLGALRRGARRETYFAAHPEVLDHRRIAEVLASLPAKKPIVVPVPEAVIRAAGSLAGALSFLRSGPPVFNSEKADEMLQPEWLCDVTDAQAALGQPFATDFPAGARRTWAWYLAEGWIRGDNIGPRKRD